MQNKRGIAQAFTAIPTSLTVRRATVFDVFDMSRILTRSITELCGADHGNDPEVIARWTEHKTPEGIRDWFQGSHELWLALLQGQPAGVGAISPDGEVSVLYVIPDAIGQGVGATLLTRLEGALQEAGHEIGWLESTVTARDFYKKMGWQAEGAPQHDRHGVAQRMKKRL